MISAAVQQHIQQLLTTHTGLVIPSCTFTAIGGGSINETYSVQAGKYRFFCKINAASAYPSLFEYEKDGLHLLASQQVIRVPQVITFSVTGDVQILLMEWVEQGLRSADFWKTFGRQLAALHANESDHCGLGTNNYMGALPQDNTWTGSWTEFFITRRLQPQVQLAINRGLMDKKELVHFEKLYRHLPAVFEPGTPCLLHGDLWSGNFLCDANSNPVLIDPAVYYGHNSIDLAMTTLFGGFDRLFYDSYQYYHPLPPNYREQWEICNLYPLLIHLNLFGKSYLADILHTIRRY
jgi:protein-ribulosamine 3-kinase